jgi:hypothetical protein
MIDSWIRSFLRVRSIMGGVKWETHRKKSGVNTMFDIRNKLPDKLNDFVMGSTTSC